VLAIVRQVAEKILAVNKRALYLQLLRLPRANKGHPLDSHNPGLDGGNTPLLTETNRRDSSQHNISYFCRH
jgi:hypothetical protein